MKVEILIPDITRLATKTKCDAEGLVTTIQFDAKIHPGSIARILNLGRQGVPIMVSLSSPQALIDLNIEEEHSTPEETQVDFFGPTEKGCRESFPNIVGND